MKRSIVRHGPSTLTVSLPSSWVKKNNLSNKSDLDVVEKGEQLIINAKKEDEYIKLIVDIKNNNHAGKRYINAAYRKGCDELIIFFDDIGFMQSIEECLSDETLGFEIIKHGKEASKHYCIIKDIPGTKFDEFDTILERVWIILIAMSEDILESLNTNDKKILQGFPSLDKRINKFTNFCIRILNKRGHPKFKNVPVYYRLLKILEELADNYKFLAKHLQEKKDTPSHDFLNLAKEIDTSLKMIYKSFYRPSDELIEKIFSETKERFKNIDIDSKNKSDTELIPFLVAINIKIRSLASAIIELNIISE